jgi:hypothetical protein
LAELTRLRLEPRQNFLEFWLGHLDAVDNAFLVHCGGNHGALAQRIMESMEVRCTCLNFLTEPERVKSIAIEHRDRSDSTVCLVYLLDYARLASDGEYRRLVTNLEYFDDWDRTRIRLLADVPDFLFESIFRSSRDDLQRFARMLHDKVRNARQIVVRGRGTHLEVRVGEWYANDGKPHDHILPCGELAGIPASIEGCVTVDGTLLGTIPFGFKYGRIKPGDLILEFRDRHVHAHSGANKELVADFETLFAALPTLRRIGEAAISFNTSIDYLPGIGFQWEEKFPGFHFGMGAELSENLTTLQERQCDHHIDVILDDVSIHADSAVIFEARKFTF